MVTGARANRENAKGSVAVLVVERSPRLRRIVLRLFATLPCFRVVGSASAIQAALRQCRALRPGVVVTGLQLRDGNGVELVRITARKQAAEALQRSERDQRQLAQQLAVEKARLLEAQTVAKIGSWETDLATGAVKWSDETHRVMETDPSRFQPTHQSFLLLVHPDDRIMVDEAFARSLTVSTPCAITHRLRMPDGRIKFVEERWQIIPDEKSQPSRAIGTCRDITDQKQAESEVRRSEERFRAIFEQAGIGIALVEPHDGRFLRCNQAVAEMFGYGIEELCRLTVRDVSEPDDYEIDRRQWDRMLAGAIPRFQMEKRYRRKDGKLMWGLLTSTLVRDSEGRPQFVVGMVEDITRRRTAEHELLGAELQLHALVGRLNAVREEEAKRIARELHDDLGQHLTALNMEITGLQTMPASSASEFQNRLSRMREVVNHTIDVVQKISGELRLGQLDLLGLAAAIEWQLPQFQERSGLRCTITEMNEVGGLTDEQATAVFRVVQEALTNIARHAQATAVGFSLTTDRGQLRAEVRDNGRGITPEQLADRTAYGLLGMRERVEALGGQIVINGAAGRGTTVLVTLPVTVASGTTP